MAITVRDAIFLGNFADADTDENTPTVENPGIYQQTFGGPGSPLFDNVQDVTFNDANNDGGIFSNNTANGPNSDTVTGTSGATQLDSLALVNGTVTYNDGSTVSYTDIVMFQTSNGDLYLTNSNFAGTDLNVTGKWIESFTVTSVVDTNWAGLLHLALQDFTCFVAGTRIATPRGDTAIERLRVGDLVDTLDHGAQPIRWIGQSTVLGLGKMAPVRIAKGALGVGLPVRDLWVSQQHRMLIRSPIVERMIGTDEGLVAAKALLPLTGFDVCAVVGPVTYLHMLFDRHEVIIAQGAPTESLLPGPQALEMMGPQCRAELDRVLVRSGQYGRPPVPARDILEGPVRKNAVLRHAKNAKPVLQGARPVAQAVTG